MSSGLRIKFRQELTTWLRQRPRETPVGRIQESTCRLAFGYPSGDHGEVDCWIYRRNPEPLEMYFAFYQNFTDDDLLCKVMPVGGVMRPGEGATIQFNGDECMKASGTGAVNLWHHGRVTVRHAISRAKLVETITVAAPEGLTYLRKLDPEQGWPLLIGGLDDPSSLVDQMFIYAYCIEQAKRYLRGEVALPRLSTARAL